LEPKAKPAKKLFSFIAPESKLLLINQQMGKFEHMVVRTKNPKK
jgi:hypothetical protein